MSTIEKIFFCFAVLICLFLAGGCEKKTEETPPPAPTLKQYILNYTAGENGFLEGEESQTVDQDGDGSKVTAVPAGGYHFVNWSDGVTDPIRTDRNVKADIGVIASFALNQYTLTYIAEENGTIDGVSPQIVDHGGDGSTVAAVPAEYYHFAGWSDGVSTPSRTELSLAADIKVTARFIIDQYQLVYAAEKNGSIKGASSQKVDHGGSGSRVTAIPADGYHFNNWSDGLTTASRTDSDLNGDLKLTASFSLNQYTLTYAAGKNGSIDGTSPQTVMQGSDGSQVTAVPAEHHHFVDWSDGVSTPGRSDRNITADIKVTANFVIDQHSLSYTAEENGSVKGARSQKVDHRGTGSKVTAIPAVGYHFINWSDGITKASRTDSDVKSDLAVTAGFALNQYTLTFKAGEHGTIDGTANQTVEHGNSASTVTAVADRGYHFVKWNDDVVTAQRAVSNVTGDLTVTAFFEVNTYSIGGTVSGLVENTQVVLRNNTGDDLVITANGDFKFMIELFNEDAYAVEVLSQPTTPNQTCTVSYGTGIVPDESVNNIFVECVLNTYTIGGTITGLTEGDQAVLRYNDGNDLVIRANGNFSFDTPLEDGSSYEVKVHNQPEKPNWICIVENATGVLTGDDINDIVVDCYPEVVLQASAGIRKVKLEWNSYDFSEVTFNLCIAQEEIPIGGFSSCNELTGGILETKVNSPIVITQLTNDIPYWFQLEALYDSGRQTLSEVVMAIPFGGLNDSGIDWCADDTTNRDSDGTRTQKIASCTALASSHPGQDGSHGRDGLASHRKLTKTGNGSAGFDFTKMCMSGDAAGEEQCPPNPSPGSDLNNWACIRDNVTGLTWEVKTDVGLRSRSSTYTWYNPDKTVNGGVAGLKNGGKCEDSDCDTQAYVQAINEIDLCGASDWRLPTKRELLSIVDNSRFKPAVDTRFFSNTLSLYYWSSSTYSEEANSAWQVYFLYGEASPNFKNKGYLIRLVRGRAVTFGLENP